VIGTGSKPALQKLTNDFDFLQGNFDVLSRRLTAPLSGKDD
jgi:hypothetical protein